MEATNLDHLVSFTVPEYLIFWLQSDLLGVLVDFLKRLVCGGGLSFLVVHYLAGYLNFTPFAKSYKKKGILAGFSCFILSLLGV